MPTTNQFAAMCHYCSETIPPLVGHAWLWRDRIYAAHNDCAAANRRRLRELRAAKVEPEHAPFGTYAAGGPDAVMMIDAHAINEAEAMKVAAVGASRPEARVPDPHGPAPRSKARRAASRRCVLVTDGAERARAAKARKVYSHDLTLEEA